MGLWIYMYMCVVWEERTEEADQLECYATVSGMRCPKLGIWKEKGKNA